jgi:aldose 1-epimerase
VFDGQTHQLPIDEIAHTNAIHGLVRWVPWTVREQDGHRVVVEHVLHPRPGYPFTLAVAVEYELSATGLTVRTTATNVGTFPCPYGSGSHPYVTVGTPTVDEALLRLPAAAVLRTDERALPVETVPLVDGDLDFRHRRRIGSSKLDHCFTQFDRDDAGIARVALDDGDRRGLTVWFDDSYQYVMVYTGDAADVGRRGLAVEPMTCAPNAFRSGDGLLRLEPAESHRGVWGIAPV